MSYIFENNDITLLMNSYLRREGLNNYRVVVAVDNKKNRMYVVAKGQQAIYENISAEAIGTYLDILVTDKKFRNNGL